MLPFYFVCIQNSLLGIGMLISLAFPELAMFSSARFHAELLMSKVQCSTN